MTFRRLPSPPHPPPQILRRTGTPSQQASAAAIMPLLRNPHRLLVTLLLGNSLAAEALPLYLDRLANPITAVIVSVTVVLIFGEIIPQAVCSSYGLEAGAAAAPFVHVFMFLCAPLAWPIGWVLDRLLGAHRTALFKRAQLKALVDIHHEGQTFGGQLSSDEVGIIKGALDLTSKTADQAMTPLDLVFMLSSDAVLDADTQTAILASGHSRIPVFRAGNRFAGGTGGGKGRLGGGVWVMPGSDALCWGGGLRGEVSKNKQHGWSNGSARLDTRPETPPPRFPQSLHPGTTFWALLWPRSWCS